jgi:hypothetical protein
MACDCSISLALSWSGMKNINVNDARPDFVFVVDGVRYDCPRLVAQFLSPTVCFLHSVDVSNPEYMIGTKDPNDQFQLFLSLGQGSSIQVASANYPFFLSVARELSNSDLYTRILNNCHLDFVLGELGDPDFLTFFSDSFIGTLASAFYHLNSSELDHISVFTLYHILSHNLLQLSSEDSLYSYIRSSLSTNSDYFEFFQFIRFEYLSPECISDFLSIVPNCIDHHLWAAISPRLPSPLLHSPTESRKEIEFPLQRPGSLEGIISYLTVKHGGNVYDKGIVTITSKSVHDHPWYSALPMCAVRNIVDLTSELYFNSKDAPDEWICLDFQDLRITPTHYAIRSKFM